MISIIIPVFNGEKTIEILVNNISKTLTENYDFEIVLVNDCSTDNSEEKCKELVKKYPNVSLYSLSKNVGEHNAVMAGLNKCVGDYAVIMDDANIGDECIVGALCFIKGEMQIPNRKVIVGNPAQIKGDVSDDMINWKTKGTKLYQELPKECKTLMNECSPLTEIEKNRKEKQRITFETWKKTK